MTRTYRTSKGHVITTSLTPAQAQAIIERTALANPAAISRFAWDLSQRNPRRMSDKQLPWLFLFAVECDRSTGTIEGGPAPAETPAAVEATDTCRLVIDRLEAGPVAFWDDLDAADRAVRYGYCH